MTQPDDHSRRFVAATHANTYCPTGVQLFAPRRRLLRALPTLLGFTVGCLAALGLIIFIGAYA